MKTFTLSILVILLGTFSSIVPASKMPDPTVSEFAKTESGGFIVERGQGVRYAMTYALLSPSKSATTYKVVFDNPELKGDPLHTEGPIATGTPELMVQSSICPGVKNGRTYTVLLSLYADGELLGTHKDKVKFSMPSNLMKQMGIKEY